MLAAVVVSVTGVASWGVKVVVHEMLAPTAKLAAEEPGVQTVVASAGAPVTVQVADVAASGPALVHTLVTETGVPGVLATVVGAVDFMSAN